MKEQRVPRVLTWECFPIELNIGEVLAGGGRHVGHHVVGWTEHLSLGRNGTAVDLDLQVSRPRSTCID